MLTFTADTECVVDQNTISFIFIYKEEVYSVENSPVRTDTPPEEKNDEEEDENICPVCYDSMENMMIYPCEHKVCFKCLRELMRRNFYKCSMCRAEFIRESDVEYDEGSPVIVSNSRASIRAFR